MISDSVGAIAIGENEVVVGAVMDCDGLLFAGENESALLKDIELS